ncbi:MFS transporter [Pandoraea sputorum]|nr:MFS transporter [Pandoraea sputorum]
MVVTYSVATAIFGGTAPIVCAYLIDSKHLLTAPAIYILITGMLATPVAYRILQQDVAHLPFQAVG